MDTVDAVRFHSGLPEPGRTFGAAPSPDITAEFEAVLLRPMVSAMLPKAESVFGSGPSNGIWHGMMAETIATAWADREPLGLGAQITDSEGHADHGE